MRKSVESFLNHLVKVELLSGSVSVGELTKAEDDFLEITHRNGMRSVINYSCVSQIAELPGR